MSRTLSLLALALGSLLLACAERPADGPRPPHTPTAPFAAWLEAAPLTATARSVTLRVAPRPGLRGAFELTLRHPGRVETTRLAPTGGAASWTVPAAVDATVTLAWRDPSGVMGAHAELTSPARPIAAAAPRWAPLPVALGAVREAIPLPAGAPR